MTDAATMGLNMTKGQKLSFTKAAPHVTKFRIAMGWDEGDFDLDLSAFCLGADGKLPMNGADRDPRFVVYFNQTDSADGSVHHTGDNLTGAGDGDDETILVDLSKVDPRVTEISFVNTIYHGEPKHQTFDLVSNAYVRVIVDDTGEEVCRYNLDSFPGSTGVQVGSLVRENGEWHFEAVGTGYKADLEMFLQQYT